jgi:hypothetical protein
MLGGESTQSARCAQRRVTEPRDFSMLPAMLRSRQDLGSLRIACWIASALALGCGGDKTPPHTVTPAPAAPAEPPPAAPELPQGRDVPQAAPNAPTPPAALPVPSASAKAPASNKPARESTAQPAKVPPPPEPSAVVPAAEPPIAAPAPPAPAAAEAPVKKNKVTVPSTEHVKIDVPKGMQALLDADTRMQPWVEKVVAVADRCYQSKGMGSSATIVVDVTMHKNARPDADVRSLPPTLAGVVACATGDLMRTKMPLFTGPEGERHTVKIRFK